MFQSDVEFSHACSSQSATDGRTDGRTDKAAQKVAKLCSSAPTLLLKAAPSLERKTVFDESLSVLIQMAPDFDSHSKVTS